jgi:glycosyl hydrolase family 59 (putative galactocerebrosidase)
MDGNRLRVYPSTRPIFIAAALACAIACAGSAVLAQQGAPMIAIEKMDVGAAPADFDFGLTGQGRLGQWVVTRDASATGGRAIEQSSADRTDYRFPLAIYKPFSAKNVDVSVRFKAVAGSVDQAGGIALRLVDPDNYYVARANALEDNVRFYRLSNGRRIQIAGANLKVSPNEWHALGLKAEGESFTVTFDGKELYRATDKSITAAGRVGLWTKADSVTRFDRIEIKPLP